MMPPLLALAIMLPLGVSEAVQLEIVKVIGITVSAVASSFAVWIAHRNRRNLKDVERKVDRKRKAVREGAEDGQVVVVEERRKGEGR